jgi:hypothetical protein
MLNCLAGWSIALAAVPAILLPSLALAQPKPAGPGGSCTHGYTSSGSFCVVRPGRCDPEGRALAATDESASGPAAGSGGCRCSGDGDDADRLIAKSKRCLLAPAARKCCLHIGLAHLATGFFPRHARCAGRKKAGFNAIMRQSERHAAGSLLAPG